VSEYMETQVWALSMCGHVWASSNYKEWFVWHWALCSVLGSLD